MSLEDDITFFHHKVKFEPSMSGTYHMTSQVLTSDEYAAIRRVLDAATKYDNAKFNIDRAWIIWANGPKEGQTGHNHVRAILAAAHGETPTNKE